VAAAVMYGGAILAGPGSSPRSYSVRTRLARAAALELLHRRHGRRAPAGRPSRGGIAHALMGSLVEVAIAVAVTLPLGVGTAVYMTEIGGGSPACPHHRGGETRCAIVAACHLPVLIRDRATSRGPGSPGRWRIA